MGKPFIPGDLRRDKATQFQKGADPRRNAGGKISIKRDLENASKLFTAEHRELFHIKDDEPLTPEALRALWWAMIAPVAIAGPKKPDDANHRYASTELANRLMGKPKETVEIVEPTKDPEIDWSAVPLADRKRLLEAMEEIEQIAPDVERG